MAVAIPDAVITDYDDRIDQLDLPDPDDRHVLAAAIAARASLITANLADFPRSAVPPGVSVLAPDDFVLSLIQADLEAVATVVDQQAAALRRPPMTTAEVLEGLAMVGFTSSSTHFGARRNETCQSGDPAIDQCCDRAHRIGVRLRHQMPVLVVGEAHGGMPQPLGDDQRVLPSSDQVRGMRVPEAVQSDVRKPRAPDPTLESLGYRLWMQWLSVRVTEHEVVIPIPASGGKAPGNLLGAMRSEDRNGLGIQVDPPPTVIRLGAGPRTWTSIVEPIGRRAGTPASVDTAWDSKAPDRRNAALTDQVRAVASRAVSDDERQTFAVPLAEGEYDDIDLSLLDREGEDDRRLLIQAEHPEFHQALASGQREVHVGGVKINPVLHIAMHQSMPISIAGTDRTSWVRCR